MDTRDMIMETAFIGFLEEGFHGISLNEIIKRTGMTKGAFYHYFKSKETLLKEIMQKYFHTFIADSMHQFVEEEGPINNRLQKAAMSISGVQDKVKVLSPNIADIRSFLILLQQALLIDESLLEVYQTNIRQTKSTIAAMLEEGQKQKEIRDDLDPEDMAEMVNVIIKGTLFENSLTSGASIDVMLRYNLSTLLELFKVRKEPY